MADIFQDEDYCRIHTAWGIKSQEVKMCQLRLMQGEGTQEELERLKGELNDLKKQKHKAYAKVFYHKRIKNTDKYQKRRENENKYRERKRQEKRANDPSILFENENIIVYSKK
jgi:hypothetical protein